MLLACKNDCNQIQSEQCSFHVDAFITRLIHKDTIRMILMELVTLWQSFYACSFKIYLEKLSPDGPFQDAGRLKKSTNFSAEFPSDLLIVTRSSAAIAYLASVAREEFCGYAATVNRIDDVPVVYLTYTTRRSIDRLLFYTSRSGYH